MTTDKLADKAATVIPISTDITVGKHTVKESVWPDGRSAKISYMWEGDVGFDRDGLKRLLYTGGFRCGDSAHGALTAVRGEKDRFLCNLIWYNSTTRKGRLVISNTSLVDDMNDRGRIQSSFLDILDLIDGSVNPPRLRL